MRRPPRAVLDTSVVVSALVFRAGPMAALRLAWQATRFEPLVDRTTASELIRVLAYPKFGLAPEDREALLADYLPWCRVIAIPRRDPGLPSCKDPDDVPFLRLAVAGKADFLVTGDKALLEVGGGLRCPIVRATEFLQEVSD